MALDKKDTNADDQISHLRELIAALERRVPRIERVGEVQIARDAASLKKKALKRIADLERSVRGGSAEPTDKAAADKTDRKGPRTR